MKIVLDGVGAVDGIVVDAAKRYMYWTNMGVNTPNTERFELNDGSIERADFDGTNRKVIVPAGATFTPKQLTIDNDHGKLYWCDREGMRVMCSNKDGSNVTTLVQTGEGDADRADELRRCVGIAVDVRRGHIYWTQKGTTRGNVGRIFRAGIALPDGATPANRADIELLWDHLPEPIDMDIDEENGILYWTDRGAAPKGNTVNRADITGKTMPEPQILCDGLKDAIGLTLDLKNKRVFFVDVAGNLYTVNTNGEGFRKLYSGDHVLTGIKYVD
ncbi:MAG TPA: hypothetical protein VGM41_01640 [Chitinophagaceae bacterium]